MRLDVVTLEWIKVECLRRRISMQQLIEIALREWRERVEREGGR